MSITHVLNEAQKLLYKGLHDAARVLLMEFMRENELFRDQKYEVLLLIGDSFFRESKFINATRYYSEVRSLASSENNAHYTLLATSHLGRVAYEQKNYLQALQWVNDVIDEAKRLGFDEIEAMSLGIKSEIYCSGYGPHGQRVIAMIADIHQHPSDAKIKELKRKDLKQAGEYLERALTLYQNTNNQHGSASILCNFGRVCFNLDRDDEALHYFHEALERFMEIGDQIEISVQHNNLGIFLAYKGLFNQATDLLEKAVATRLRIKNYVAAARTQEFLGAMNVNKYFYHFDTAIHWYKAAIHSLQQVRLNIAGTFEQQEIFIGDVFETYRELVELLCQRYVKRPDKQLLQDIFHFLELFKAYVLLARAQYSIDDLEKINVDSEHTLEREMELVDQIDALGSEIYKAWKSPLPQEIIDTLLEEKSTLQKELDDLRLSTLNTANGIGALDEVNIPSLNSFTRQLPPEDVFISFIEGTKDVYALKVCDLNVRLFRLGATADVKNIVATYREGIQDRRYYERKKYIEEALPLWHFVNKKGQLFDQTARHYSVSTDAHLSLVSIDGLPVNDDKENQRFAGLEYKIKYVPSASFYLLLKQRSFEKKASDYTNTFWGIGVTGGGVSRTIKRAEAHITDIAKQFGSHAITSINPSKQELLFTLTKPHQIIHFMTHGFQEHELPGFEKDLPGSMDPVLLLGENPDLSGSIMLSASDIINANIPSRLVSLAACNTGYGRILRGEGVHSIARAFLGSGTHCVIASMWKVRDDVADKFMRHFFKILPNHTIEDAFFKSRIHIANNNVTAFDWAPFILIGNGSQNI